MIVLIQLFAFISFLLSTNYIPDIIPAVFAQQNCAKKYIGDADCVADPAGRSVTILDNALWYAEFIGGCSSTALAGCGTDRDGNGSAMDANFNFPGTNYIATDQKVDVFDYAVWIQGFLAEQMNVNTPTPTPSTILTLTPTTSVVPPTATPTQGALITPPSGTGGAFPGAEGYGAQAKGGRGGKVMFVTNLNDSGAGSLRDCMLSSGARTCIFKVGGTIVLNSRIEVTNPFLTVAGQSSQGGIQIKMSSSSGGEPILIRTHNVILRYLTIRPGTLGANSRALSISAGGSATRPNNAHDVIVDHLSTSWSEDEQIITWYDTSNVTIQNSLIAEGLASGVQKGPNLGGGGNGGIGGPYTFYGNVVAFFFQRMPRVRVSKAGEDIVDVVNNVIYNPTWEGNHNGLYLSDGGRVNAIGNYLKAPSSASHYIYVESGQVYAKGNITPNRPTDTGSESTGVVSTSTASSPFTPASGAKPVSSPKSAQAAYDTGLASAGNSAGLDCSGNWVARRDSLDTRIINDIRNRTGSLKTSAGPWPTYTSGTACPDTDNDGMSDTWETAKGLSVGTADNNGNPDNDGYTNLEEFLNGTNPK